MYSTVALLFLMLVRPSWSDGNQDAMELHFVKHHERLCKKMLETPYYREEAIIGQVWREYYNWRVITTKCQITEFRRITKQTILRIERQMEDFIREPPPWDQATMLAKSGHYEMLMFRVPEPPGAYMALYNLAKFGGMYDFALHQVKLQGLALKLLRNDKFLIMLDCSGGLGHLLCRKNETVTKEEVLSVAQEVGLGSGKLGCTSFIQS